MSKPLFQTPQSLHSSSCLGLDLNLDLDLDLNHWHKWAQLSRTANPENKEKSKSLTPIHLLSIQKRSCYRRAFDAFQKQEPAKKKQNSEEGSKT